MIAYTSFSMSTSAPRSGETEPVNITSDGVHIQKHPSKFQPPDTVQQVASVSGQEIFIFPPSSEQNTSLSDNLFDVSSPTDGQEQTVLLSGKALEVQIGNYINDIEQEGAMNVPYHETPEDIRQNQPPIIIENPKLELPSTDIHMTFEEEPEGTENVFSPALIDAISDTSHRASRKVILKDIILEYTSPRHLHEELTLAVRRNNDNDQIRLAEITPTRWKAVEIIECDHNAGNILLVAHSKERGDEGFLIFSPDEMYTMTSVEEDIAVNYEFTSTQEDNHVEIKISFTIVNEGDYAPATQSSIATLRNAKKHQQLFEETGNVKYLTEIIVNCPRALRPNPGGLDVVADMIWVLAWAYYTRYNCTRILQDISYAISYSQKGVDLTPAGHANLPARFSKLGISYSERFKHTGNLADIEYSISYHHKALDITPFGHTSLPARFRSLGISYSDRFDHTGNFEDIEHSISYYNKALDITPSGHASLPATFRNLGISYSDRFEYTGNLEDIEHSISYHHKAVDLTPSGHADLSARFNSLGISYSCRFEHTGNLEDIEHSISYHHKALDITPSGHANIPARFSNLGNSYVCRFEHTGNLDDIEHSISYHHKAVDLTPFGHADLPYWFSNLGNSYGCRFKHTENLEDIEYSISYHHKALDLTPSGHASLPARFSSLGISYSDRFDHTGNLEDIEHSISYYNKAVDLTPSGHASLPARFSNLGISYSKRFKHTGNIEDIEHSISYHHKALDLTPSGHADLPGMFGSLGISYSDRFNHTGNLEDIEHSISYYNKAVDLTPSGHASLPARFSNLGVSYSKRFRHTGNIEDIEHSISYYNKALDLTPSGHASLPARFSSLGISYSDRFDHTGNLEDIEHSISYYNKAVDLTPSGHASLPARFSNLGISYSKRFKHTGNIEDIEHSISYHHKALDLTPSGHADLPGMFGSLGISYSDRFNHTGNLEDIEHSISYYNKAVDLTPSGHADLPASFNSLGNSYGCRFEHTGNLADIEYSISYHHKALDLTPSGHADLPGTFRNLGISYSNRFDHTGNLDDIEHSISYHHKAVDLTPSGHADLSGRFNSLGISYSCRFEHTGNLEDIKYSIYYKQKSVDLTPSKHVDLPSRLNNLANSYLHRFEAKNDLLDIQKCIISYRRGAESNGSPSDRLECAKNAAFESSIHDQSQCLVDFTLAITLLAEIAGMEQTIHRRFSNLHEHSDIVKSAVHTALDLNSPHLAIEWLEQGRCLVWNQLHQLRTPMDDLRIQNPALADQFLSVTSALESYGTRSKPSIASSKTTLADEIRLQNDAHNHTHHAAHYKKLLDDIRSLPNFHSWLRPPKLRDILSSLPKDGPIIVFNLHEVRCDALALIPGFQDPMHIYLDKFSLEKAKELLKTLRFDILKHREVEDQDRTMPQRVKSNPSSMSYILKEVWCNIVQPILETLGYSPDKSERRRIWWCPTGPLAFLPLHAAGIYGREYTLGSCISDYAVSSYTPTVQSLNAKFSASSAPAKRDSILLINPNTPSLPAIPFTAIETRALKELFGNSALLLENAKADTINVKSEINTHSWVHFACHGIQDRVDPLKSGVHLYDGRLDLLEIMRLKLPNSELAFLSACQTGKGDLNLSEEAVHLAAGMLAAGFHGVVATMWSISDLHAPEFAKHFYEYLLRQAKGSFEGLDSRQAAYALDYATRTVRETLGEDDAAFLTWVPYVHFGY